MHGLPNISQHGAASVAAQKVSSAGTAPRLEDYAERIHAVLGPLVAVGASVALFDFPNYPNVGDSAIRLGQEIYLRSKLRARIVHVDDCTAVGRPFPALPEAVVILIHGGGNLGDLYPHHQILREKLIERYPHHRIIQLPQSIHFLDARNEEQCRRVFGSHRDFHLLVRDHESLKLGQRLHHGPTRLSPDMALCLGRLGRSAEPRHPIVGLLRTDEEQASAGFCPVRENRLIATDLLNEPSTLTQRLTGRVDRWLRTFLRSLAPLSRLKRQLYHHLAHEQLKRGRDILGSGQVVITDRLHGHILCILMGISHVALDNSYRKIGNFFDAWNTGAGLCQRASTLNDALDRANDLLKTLQFGAV
ncbi:MAG: hypothetical protein EA405_13710 [Rhodospirillales bacterium]|nr:MAG: hypothetical protein EA405_13710 [Rhodospirillales bacterium]